MAVRPTMGSRFLGRGPELTPEQLEKMKAQDELKRLQAEERQIQREIFRKCGHDYKDITEERRGLLEGRDPPGWVKALIEKGDHRWSNRSEVWRRMKYEKCGSCGLVRVSNEEP